MTLPAAQQRLSVAEYLDLDAEAQDVRYEYHDGRVVALAGASPEHGFIKDNIGYELHGHLRDTDCRTTTSDLRVRVESRYVYPDIVGLCDDAEYTSENPATLLNPVFLAEVTSPSTREIDTTVKRDAYLELDSLQEYWVVEPDQAYIAQYVRHGDNWVYRTVKGLGTAIRCEAFDVQLPLARIYADVLTETR